MNILSLLTSIEDLFHKPIEHVNNYSAHCFFILFVTIFSPHCEDYFAFSLLILSKKCSMQEVGRGEG